MSKTMTTTIRVVIPTAYQLLMQRIVSTCQGLEAVPTRDELTALTRSMSGKQSTQTALERLERRHAAVAAAPGVVVAARTTDPDGWATSERLLAESRSLAATSPTRAASVAERADSALRLALNRGADALAVEERTLVSSTMEQSLRSIGCHTTIAVAPSAIGIWAQRGHQLVAVRVEDGGRVELDVAGFEGEDCVPFHEEIEAAVVAHGGVFEHVEVADHRDAEGGVLIRNASRAAGPGGDMARAIAEQAPVQAEPRFSRESGRSQTMSPQRVTGRSGK